MNHFYKRLRLYCFLPLLLLLATRASATHIYGADFYYTYISGTSYKVTLVIYGDCSGQNFPYLSGATPTVTIYNTGTQTQSFLLHQDGPPLEVTPVCPSQINNTACKTTNTTIPGVMRFIYDANVNLGGTSANWLFRFNGDMGNNSFSGRSNSITNVTSGTIMALEATLDNTSAPNSSPVYTTIPTPFFCINKPANYNPGAVDPDNDSLTFSLVPGLQQSPPGGTVSYVNPYTATEPLQATAGTFSFSASTGQLSFTPDAVQKSLVVGQVNEYRNGLLVGTSMREMTFVVIGSCNNNPPGGIISNPSTGSVITNNSTQISICASQGTLTFSINPTDLDGNNITVTSAGLPTGASFVINGSGTSTPTAVFSWSVLNVTPGSYNFFVTYTDDGCPLSSKQTLAYTIVVNASPKLLFTQTTLATCTKKAIYTVTPSTAPSPYTIKVIQAGNAIKTNTNVTGTITDSLAPGTYTIRVINPTGCLHDTVVTIAPPPVINATTTTIAPSCPGMADGSASISASGGLAPFTYAIGAGTYGTATTFSNLAAGTYTLHVKDANLCVKDEVVVVPPGTPVLVHVSIKRPTCNHFSNGAVTLTGYNNTAPYSYAMAAGAYSSTNTFSNLAAGSYLFHIKSAGNCIKDTTIAITDSLKITATLPITNVVCNGDGNGSITVNATGGVAPYSYALGAGAASNVNTFSNLGPGTYAIHIKDTLLCFLDTTATITQPAVLTLTAVGTNVACFNTSTGSIALTAAGGTMPYAYRLNTGAYVTSSTFSNLTAGTYSLTVKDAHNCTATSTVTITQPTAITETLTAVPPTCNGAANGSVTVATAGGTPPYTYAVGAGAYGNSNVTTTVAGTITVHVKDANGCIKDTTFTLGQPPAIAVTAAVVKPICSTLANGSVTLSASGGTGSFTYAQGAGSYSNSNAFSPLAAGTYTFHVKDANACIKDTVITLTDSLVITAATQVTDATCNGTANGAITLTPGGGIPAYTYAQGTGSYGSNPTFTSLIAGTYTLHVKDANGCITDVSATIAQPSVIVPTVSIVRPFCYEQNNGVITLTAAGGTPGYTFAIGSGTYSTSGVFDTISATTYVLHVQDANGCQHDTTVTITQPPSLQIDSLPLSNVKCFGGTSGFATAYAEGGTLPYTYASDAGAFQSNNLLTGLNAGAHIIHIKDANGCAVDSTITLIQPDQLLIDSATLKMPTCEGFTDGAATLYGTGGTPAYTFSADGVIYAVNATFSNIGEGAHPFYIQDVNNCVYDTTITFTGYPHIIITSGIGNSVSCHNDSDGSITVMVTGGVQPLTYTLGATTTSSNTFDSLLPGNYPIIITDSKGCLKDTSITVGNPDVLAATIQATPNDCIGYDNSGQLQAIVTGGTQPYIYAWNTAPGIDTPQLTGLANGRYILSVTDAHHCATNATNDVVYDDCCKPYIPDAFTPNGDGRNDRFRILFKGDAKLLNLSVFDRYGERVFYTFNIEEGWDGTFRGKPMDMGTYFYQVKLICGNKGDNVVEYKGDVTLIR